MSEQRLLQDYLNDITESITDIKEFTKGITICMAIDDLSFSWRSVGVQMPDAGSAYILNLLYS
jgi:uncharacterized protein with HEPN domain